jgi:uncharacterized protein
VKIRPLTIVFQLTVYFTLKHYKSQAFYLFIMAKCDYLITGLGALANERVTAISIADEQGNKGDKATITLDDRDFMLAAPPIGQIFSVSIGYTGADAIPLQQIGTYQLDERSYTLDSGSGKTIQISGNAQHHVGNSIKAPRTETYEEKTLFEIFGYLAVRNGYIPNITAKIGANYYDHIVQESQSDLAFISEVADKHDGYLKFENGKMSIKSRNETEGEVTLLGKAMGQIPIGQGAMLTVPSNVRFTESSRTNYKSCLVHWNNEDKGERLSETIGSGEAQYEIKNAFQNKPLALVGGSAKLEQLARGTGEISFTVPGDPGIKAGIKLIVPGGFRQEMTGEYIIRSVTHTMNSSGYITSGSGDRDMT